VRSVPAGVAARAALAGVEAGADGGCTLAGGQPDRQPGEGERVLGELPPQKPSSDKLAEGKRGRVQRVVAAALLSDEHPVEFAAQRCDRVSVRVARRNG
jgi:hypothetical protein